MARLEEFSYTLVDEDAIKAAGGSWREIFAAEDEALNALIARSDEQARAGKLKDTLFHTPVGDGAAWYIVTKERPFTLAHLAFGDAWNAPWYIIDGLTAATMRAYNEQTIRFNDAWAEAKAERAIK